MARMRPPSYALDGVVQAGMVYTLCGNTGHGKTAAALLLTSAIASGMPFCGRDVRPGSVMFLAGENPDNVRHQWFGLCADLGSRPDRLPVHWHDGAFSLDAAAECLMADAARIPDLRLVVADTLQAFFEGDDDNSNPQMLAAARQFRALARRLPSHPAVIIPAHPVKNARRDNLVPRGGSAFLNEIDGNLTIWADQSVATLHWQGKLRGPSFEPLKIELVRTEPPGLCDEAGRQMPCTVARPLLTLREEQIAREAMSREDRALAAIKANPKISKRGLADAVGIHESSAQRLIVKLRDEWKWIKKHGRNHVLTADGEAVLDG
jgi:hypothetical protein